jgi:hypothetical protein
VEAKAAANRKRVDAWRHSQKGGNSVGNGVTNDVRTHAVTQHVHDTPNPNPNPSSSCRDLGGRVTKVDAREPRPHCSKHPNENSEDQCRPCMKRRKWDEAHKEQSQADELDAKRQQRESIRTARDACLLCDENGMRAAKGGLKRCDHQESAHA